MITPPPAEWWQHAPALLARLASRPLATGPVWFRFGDGHLVVASEDRPFRERCHTLFRECVVDPADGRATVALTIRVDAPTGLRLITIREAVPPDLAALTRRTYAERGYRAAVGAPGGWSAVAHDDVPPHEWPIGTGPHLLAADGGDWRPLVGSLAVSRALANQPDVLFLHAGAVAMRGGAVVLAGPRGAGKTTASLALTSRGHALLSDELAAIRVATAEVLPIRRAMSIREGLRGTAVDAALRQAAPRWERFPDGSPRLRADPGALFDTAPPDALPLRWLLVLRRFADAPRVEWFTPEPGHVRLLGVVGHAPDDAGTAARGMRLFGLLRRVRCGFLDLGGPDETAACLERLDAD